VVRRVLDIYVDQASVLMPAAAVAFALSGILAAVLAASGAALALVALVVIVVATVIFTGMVVELVEDLQDGRRDATAAALLRAVRPVIGRLILVGIFAGVGIVIGFLLLVIPGLVLITVWSVAAPVVVVERPPGLKALARSRQLVRGSGWQVFGVILLLDVLVIVGSSLLQLAADSAGSGVGIVVRVVVGVLTLPLPALAAAVMYFALRGRAAEGPAALAAPSG
jgi:hypothetical protein